MSIQTITRQGILNHIIEVVKNLPDDKLQQAWEQINSWTSAFSGLSNEVDDVNDDEVLEFTVVPYTGTKHQFIRLPIRSKKTITRPTMEIGEPENNGSNSMRKLQGNIEWWNQNCDKIINNSSLHQRYIAISNGEIFFGDSYLEAYTRTSEVHADGCPYIFFLKSPNGVIDYAN